jgi:3-phytase
MRHLHRHAALAAALFALAAPAAAFANDNDNDRDQNSDPLDGDSIPGAVQQLLDSPRIDASFVPRSDGAVETSALQGGANLTHRSDPQYDTADFTDTAPGNLRADYVLPSRHGLQVEGGFVFWPPSSDPLSRLTGVFPFPTSDHRLVTVDLMLK